MKRVADKLIGTEILGLDTNGQWYDSIKNGGKIINGEEALTKLLQKEINRQLEKGVLEELKKAEWKKYPFDFNQFIESHKQAKTKHYIEGTEGEITWFADYMASDKKWKITVIRGDIQLENEFYGYEPRFGIDLKDSEHIEQILDKLISTINGQ